MGAVPGVGVGEGVGEGVGVGVGVGLPSLLTSRTGNATLPELTSVAYIK